MDGNQTLDSMTVTPDVAARLTTTFKDLKAEQPKLRMRDAAGEMGVSEGALVAAGIAGAATRLDGRWNDLITALPQLETVMVLTRNESCVHEKVGKFEEVSVGPAHGLVLGPDIDLRIFHTKWAYGWAVESEGPRGTMRSLQFFDAHGTAVHKIYLKDGSDLDAYRRLVDGHTAAADIAAPSFTPAPGRKADRPDAEVDVTAFRDAWRAMKDTHEFFGMLQKHKVGRLQALRLAGGELAYPVETGAFQAALEAARDSKSDIMIFVSSPGCVQIHTGPIETIKEMGSWLNVLDPGFNLHLRADRIGSAWVVRKPTDDGIVTSLEIYDLDGEPIALMFGRRKPGEAELDAWRAIVAGLPQIEAAA